jgi:hypothetical protein
MRIYIIGNDGITLCGGTPATLSEGEIAVASNEELHAAPLSGKRLLALRNALPGVEKRRKVGERQARIDQLWSAIEALPDPEPSDATAHRSRTRSSRCCGDPTERLSMTWQMPPAGGKAVAKGIANTTRVKERHG